MFLYMRCLPVSRNLFTVSIFFFIFIRAQEYLHTHDCIVSKEIIYKLVSESYEWLLKFISLEYKKARGENDDDYTLYILCVKSIPKLVIPKIPD